ncbi:hypothetical protein ACFQL0_14570 [Haloplanus litoreus]
MCDPSPGLRRDGVERDGDGDIGGDADTHPLGDARPRSDSGRRLERP